MIPMINFFYFREPQELRKERKMDGKSAFAHGSRANGYKNFIFSIKGHNIFIVCSKRANLFKNVLFLKSTKNCDHTSECPSFFASGGI